MIVPGTSDLQVRTEKHIDASRVALSGSDIAIGSLFGPSMLPGATKGTARVLALCCFANADTSALQGAVQRGNLASKGRSSGECRSRKDARDAESPPPPHQLAITAACVALNLAAGKLASLLSLPLPLDTIGSLTGAALFPPALAIAVGAVTAVLGWTVISPVYPYCIGTQISVVIAAFAVMRFIGPIDCGKPSSSERRSRSWRQWFRQLRPSMPLPSAPVEVPGSP